MSRCLGQRRYPIEDVLAAAHRLMHERGPEALTFDALARACGLSAATLVQRFKSKAGLKQSTLLHAWDRLDEKTASARGDDAEDADGAVGMLVALSGDYGGIEAYAEGLLVLREDLRDPVLRARGAAWKTRLVRHPRRLLRRRSACAARHRPADRVALARVAAVVGFRSAGRRRPLRRRQSGTLRRRCRQGLTAANLIFTAAGRRNYPARRLPAGCAAAGRRPAPRSRKHRPARC